MSRILHLMTSFVRGGAERNILFSVEWERRQGHDVHIAFGAESVRTQIPVGVAAYDVPALVRRIRPYADALAVRQIKELIHRVKPEIIHTHQSKAGVLGRLAARRSDSVIVHTVHMPSFGPAYSAPASLCFESAERYCARFTDLFITVGTDLRERYLSAGIGYRGQYYVVRSPVNIERYLRVRRLSVSDRQAIRRRLGIPGDVRVALAVGTLEPRKRFPLIIRSLAPLLRDSAHEVVLLVCGAGKDADQIRQLAVTLGIERQVVLPGFVDALDEILAISSLLVHASRAEGVSQVVVQAVAAGVPVVATDVDGLSEVGQSNIEVVPRSGNQLLSACQRMLSAKESVPASEEMLSPWSEIDVQRQLELVHARMQALRAKGSTVRDPDASRTASRFLNSEIRK